MTKKEAVTENNSAIAFFFKKMLKSEPDKVILRMALG